MALLLRRKGVTRIRPLLGGIVGWRERGYPLMGSVSPEEVGVEPSVPT